MAKQQTDEELNLKRKARRRLIGALALSLAAVVILPMVLDSEPKSTGQDIDLRIPAPDKVADFVPSVVISEVPDVPPFAASMVIAVSAPDVASAVDAVSAPLAEVEEIAPPAASVKVVEPVAAVAEKAKEKVKEAAKKDETIKSVENKKNIEVKKAEEAKAAESKITEIKKSVASDPAAILEGREKETVNGESYVAQIGAFSNPATAKQELAKLKGWGFKAYTEKVGNKIRVRVGPYAEKEKAEKVRQLLEKHGLHPAVVPVK